MRSCGPCARRFPGRKRFRPTLYFPDKTLTHMCIVKPQNRTEMLSVSGVGEFKYEKYGERFLACVREALGAGG